MKIRKKTIPSYRAVTPQLPRRLPPVSPRLPSWDPDVIPRVPPGVPAGDPGGLGGDDVAEALVVLSNGNY